VKCSKAINESEITRSFRVSENLQPLYEVGIEGAEMLIELLETKKLFTEPKILRAELVIRRSATVPKGVREE